MKKEALWKDSMRGNYGRKGGGWNLCAVREGLGVGLWKPIRKLDHLVSSSFAFVVGNGKG